MSSLPSPDRGIGAQRDDVLTCRAACDADEERNPGEGRRAKSRSRLADDGLLLL